MSGIPPSLRGGRSVVVRPDYYAPQSESRLVSQTSLDTTVVWRLPSTQLRETEFGEQYTLQASHLSQARYCLDRSGMRPHGQTQTGIIQTGLYSQTGCTESSRPWSRLGRTRVGTWGRYIRDRPCIRKASWIQTSCNQ